MLLQWLFTMAKRQIPILINFAITDYPQGTIQRPHDLQTQQPKSFKNFQLFKSHNWLIVVLD